MKKSDLKGGMIIEAGDGCRYLVVDTPFGKYGVFNSANCNLDESYDEDLKRTDIDERIKQKPNFNSRNWDIKKVYILCEDLSYLLITDFKNLDNILNPFPSLPKDIQRSIFNNRCKLTIENEIEVYTFHNINKEELGDTEKQFLDNIKQ